MQTGHCYPSISRGKRLTGVSYYGPYGSDNTIESGDRRTGTFIYDTRACCCCRRRMRPERPRHIQPVEVGNT